MNRLTNVQRLLIVEFYYQNECSVKKHHHALRPFCDQFNRAAEVAICIIGERYREILTYLPKWP